MYVQDYFKCTKARVVVGWKVENDWTPSGAPHSFVKYEKSNQKKIIKIYFNFYVCVQ